MELKIRNKTLSLPILQGGMGVGISLEKLAGAVAAHGGMGTISAAFGGYAEPDFEKDPHGANLRALKRQVQEAKRIAKGKGMVSVNVMVALHQYADCVKAALAAGADAIVCGAGLPKDLPALAAQVPESDAALAPIVSSGRAAALICRLWQKHYDRLPDFVVLEGPQAGGHLGFTKEEARAAQAGHPISLMDLLKDVLTALEPFRQSAGRDIPVFVAGGIRDGSELRRYMDAGAAGGQFATRFIATEECDAGAGYKQAILDARSEDVTIIQSPVGMPGRALHSPLIRRVEDGMEPKPTRCARCLANCDPKNVPYCISKALIAACRGDWEHGLFFCGANVGEVSSLSTVGAQMDQIMNEWRLVV